MKPSVPQGTRDFSPAVVRRRQYLFDTLRRIFELYGFQPLETPAMENLTTLTGKYGEEGDRLIFKILTNGLHEKKDKEALHADWTRLLEKPVALPSLTERALRYDLTIPFARYVAMNHGELALPFRRYQMQPVWRADRPQRGRYREFWQCDCDVVGSTSLLNEAELLCIYRAAFQALGLPGITVKLNSRKLLAALAAACGAPEKLVAITTALDKLDKIGWDGVAGELEQRGVDAAGVSMVHQVIGVQGSNEEKLEALAGVLGEPATAGIEELRQTLAYHQQLADPAWESAVSIDISLARGLDYYTGVILEVTTDAVKMGSIGGGGRYDDLTGLFGVKGLSGVGVSFGIDRIYDVLDELGLFPDDAVSGTRVLLVNFGGADEAYALGILQRLRQDGIAAELYPEKAKLDKQLKYAGKRAIPYVLMAGSAEREAGTATLKNFDTGTQETMPVADVAGRLRAR